MFKKLRIRFLEGHFLLRKWKTNNLELQNPITHNNSGNEDTVNKAEKVLGIPWDSDKDILVYDFKAIMKDAHKSKPTKRNLLKIVSSFCDLIGLIQPILISLKILLQEAHRLKLGWDDEFCGEIKEAWERNLREIDELVNVNVDRRFESSSDEDPIVCRELHGFSDASKSGFGACVYVRSFCRSGKVTVRLLTAKSRVAPLKTETIPRLELLGNLLLSRLITSVKNALKNCVNFDKIYLWTDSKVTLSWIKAIDKEFKTFLENRLREIRNNTDVENWSYCPTEFNPADLMTRVGITKNFIENKLWWEGPEFLKLKKEQMFEFSIPEGNFDTEVRKTSSTCLSLNAEKLTCNMNNIIDFNRYSNYDKV